MTRSRLANNDPNGLATAEIIGTVSPWRHVLAVVSLSLRLFLASVLLFLKRTVKEVCLLNLIMEECLLNLIKRDEIRKNLLFSSLR